MTRFLLFCSFLISVFAHELKADTFHIAVPAGSTSGINYTTSSEPAARLIRSLATGSLIREDSRSKSGFMLWLADKIELESENLLTLHVPQSAAFTNFRRLRPEDILTSLTECQRLGVLRGVGEVEARYESEIDEDRGIQVFLSVNGGINRTLINGLSSCAIFDFQTRSLFGDEGAKGTNMISAGSYEIWSFEASRKWTLRRSKFETAGKRPPEEIVISAYTDMAKALSALRGGEEDFLLGVDDGLIERSLADPLLEVSDCLGLKAIFRKGLPLQCDMRLSAESLRYPR